ncbi:hypothetical protein [Actinoplanes sp. NPDC051859]|uniref:hypothetical protein n=1 Tax=Actinoplanes sp. NPDC051859 TaxID=3363909 RepID=UPI00378ED7C4
MPPTIFRRILAWRRALVSTAAFMVVVAGAVALAATFSRTPKQAGDPVPPVTVRMQDGWTEVGTSPDGLEGASGQARTAGRGAVADTLAFDADAGRHFADVVLVVTGRDHRAVLTVRRQDGRFERLDDTVARMADEVTDQGTAVTVTKTTVGRVPGWELRYTATPADLRSVEYLFETASGRYSADVVGTPDEVALLVTAIEVH